MTDTRAIVTGGASGIGAASARALTARGHHVVVGDIDEVAGRSVADEIGGTFAPLDVADAFAWDAVVDHHGPFGVAVLNAGIGTGHAVADDAVPVVDLPNGAYRRNAVIGFVRSMAGSLEGRGVAVSAICPGFTATNLVPPEARVRIRGLGVEILSADDVAAVVVRSIDERANGAQWVIWPGQEPHRYEWAMPVNFSEVVTRP